MPSRMPLTASHGQASIGADRFELADEVPEDGISYGLALVGKALAQPGHTTLYQC